MRYGTVFIEQIVREEITDAAPTISEIEAAGFDIKLEEKVGEEHPETVTERYRFRDTPPECWPPKAAVNLFAVQGEERHYIGSATVDATIVPDYGNDEDRIIAQAGDVTVALDQQTVGRLVGGDAGE